MGGRGRDEGPVPGTDCAVMKLDAYLDAKACLQGPFAHVPDMRGVAETLEGRHGEVVTEATLISIWGQECQRRVLRTLPRHRAPHKLDAYVRRYLAGESLVSVAASVDLPPVLLARQVLMRIGYNKQEVTRIIKWPFLVRRPGEVDDDGSGIGKGPQERWWSDEEEAICRSRHGMELSWETALSVGAVKGTVFLGGLQVPGADASRLSAEVEATCRADRYASPTQDRLRQEAGGRAEEQLYALLRERNIAFLTEGDLRARGYPRTPDAVLAREMRVDGKRVRWIDSKAMFGDPYSHMQHSEQLAAYVKLFGPGMVIYWHDFIDALAWGAVMPPSPSARSGGGIEEAVEEDDSGGARRLDARVSPFAASTLGAGRAEFLSSSESWPVLGAPPPQVQRLPAGEVLQTALPPPTVPHQPQPRRRLAPSFDSTATREASTTAPVGGGSAGTSGGEHFDPDRTAPSVTAGAPVLAASRAQIDPGRSKPSKRIQPTPLLRSDSMGSRGGSGAGTPNTIPGTPLNGGTPLGGSPVPSAPSSPFGAPRLPHGGVWNVPPDMTERGAGEGPANNVVQVRRQVQGSAPPRQGYLPSQPSHPYRQQQSEHPHPQRQHGRPVRRLRPVPVEGKLTSREIAQVRNQVMLAAQAAHNKHVLLVDHLPEADSRPHSPDESTESAETLDDGVPTIPSLLEALAREFAELGVEMDVVLNKSAVTEDGSLPLDDTGTISAIPDANIVAAAAD